MTNRNEDWKNQNFNATFSNKNNEEDEITNLRGSKEKDNYYNLNVATFTFGGRQSKNIFENNSENLYSNSSLKKSERIRNPISFKENENEKINNTKYETTDNSYIKTQNINDKTNKNNNDNLECSINRMLINNQNMSGISNNNLQTNNKISKISPTLMNYIGDHNSFLAVVIHALWNLKFIRNFILNDLNTTNEKESKNKLFYHLKSLFLKYERNNNLDIKKIRIALAESFQNRRKFLLDQPDDPVDCYFAFINSIHSLYIVIYLFFIKFFYFIF